MLKIICRYYKIFALLFNMVHIGEIKTAIVEREEEIKQKFEMERIIERDKTDKVKKLLSTDVALIITGARS